SEFIDDEDAVAAVADYLTNRAPLAVEGRRGRATTMKVLQRCQDLGCSFHTSAELMEEHWNERCSPPWDAGDIAYTCRGLRRRQPVGCDHPAAVERKRSALVAEDFESIAFKRVDRSDEAPQEKFPIKFLGDKDEAPLKKWL